MQELFKALLGHCKAGHTDLSLKYLREERSLSDEILDQFDVGYFSGDLAPLAKILPLSFLKEIGFVRESKRKDGKVYSPFARRIIFPVKDPSSKIVGFASRVLTEANQSVQRKYLNSEFSKTHYLYGLDQSSSYIRKTNTVIVVEGQIDFLRGYQEGMRNVVGQIGSMLSPRQLFILSRYANNIVLLADDDTAGKKASGKFLEEHREAYFDFYRCFLPYAKDLDSFLDNYTAQSAIRVIKKQIDKIREVQLGLP